MEIIRGETLHQRFSNYYPTETIYLQIDEEYKYLLEKLNKQLTNSNYMFNEIIKKPKINVEITCKPMDYNDPSDYEQLNQPEHTIENYKFKTNLIPGKTYVICVNPYQSLWYSKHLGDKGKNPSIYGLQSLNRDLVYYTEFLNKYADKGNMVCIGEFVEPFTSICDKRPGTIINTNNTHSIYPFISNGHSKLVFKNIRPYPGTKGITGFIVKNIPTTSTNYPLNNLYEVSPYDSAFMDSHGLIYTLENNNAQENGLVYDIRYRYKHIDPNNLYLFDLHYINIYDDVDNSLYTQNFRALTINRYLKNQATGDLVPHIQNMLGLEQISQFSRIYDPTVPIPIKTIKRKNTPNYDTDRVRPANKKKLKTGGSKKRRKTKGKL